MKKLIVIVFVAINMTGVAYAAPVTDCSVQDVGTPCVDPSSGAAGTCQLTYDGGSLTCKTPSTAAPVTPSAAPAQPTASQPQGFTALAPIPGLTDISPTSVVNSDTLAVFFNNLYKYLIGLAAALAVIMIIWGGLEISTKDSVSKNKDGKEKIYNAIFGLVLVLSPVLVFSIINPAILNLSINLPPLKTAPGTVAPLVGSTNPGLGAALAAGCKQLNAANGVALTGCPTQQAAYAFAGQCTNGVGEVIESAGNTWGVNCPQPGSIQYTASSSVPSGQGLWCFTYDYYPPLTSVAQQRTLCASSQTDCVNLKEDPSQYVDSQSVIADCALKQ